MLTRFLSALVCLTPLAVAAQPHPVVIDGAFDDWSDEVLVYQSAGGGAEAGFGRLWAVAQGDHLFLSFEVGAEINLQNDNALTLFIDTDFDATTGRPVNGIGAEIEWRFWEREGTWHAFEFPPTLSFNDLGLFSAPTVTSDRFELAVRLDAEAFGRALFPGDSVRLVLRDEAGGSVLPAEGAVTVSLLPEAAPPLPPISLGREDPDHLRLVSYNVLNDGLFDTARAFAFGRLLRAIQPDVIAFQEIYRSSPALVAARLEEMLPSAAGDRWHVSGVGSDVYLASRFPISYTEALCAVPHLASTCNGAFRLDLSARYAKDLYVVAAHPPCCTNNAFRQEELDLLMAHLRDARTDGRLPEGTPFVITGDLNLVGFAQQLRTVLTGEIVDAARFGPSFRPDWDGSDLADAVPPTTGMPAAFTWYDPSSSFHPGRLDFVIYSDSEVALGHRFTLFTPALPEALLRQHELLAEDTSIASDHLPVVADFALPLFQTPLEGGATPSPSRVGAAFPNPSSGPVSLPIGLSTGTEVQLELLDLLGRVVERRTLLLAAGRHELDLDLAPYPSGAYVLRVRVGTADLVHQVVIRI